MINKSKKAYKTISEVSKILKLSTDVSKNNKNHILRYWETQFKQIKPKIINKRRYYDVSTIDLISKIHFLLKKQGMTIKGVQNYLNNEKIKVDVKNKEIIKTTRLKYRLNKLSSILKTLKKD